MDPLIKEDDKANLGAQSLAPESAKLGSSSPHLLPRIESKPVLLPEGLQVVSVGLFSVSQCRRTLSYHPCVRTRVLPKT